MCQHPHVTDNALVYSIFLQAFDLNLHLRKGGNHVEADPSTPLKACWLLSLLLLSPSPFGNCFHGYHGIWGWWEVVWSGAAMSRLVVVCFGDTLCPHFYEGVVTTSSLRLPSFAFALNEHLTQTSLRPLLFDCGFGTSESIIHADYSILLYCSIMVNSWKGLKGSVILFAR